MPALGRVRSSSSTAWLPPDLRQVIAWPIMIPGHLPEGRRNEGRALYLFRWPAAAVVTLSAKVKSPRRCPAAGVCPMTANASRSRAQSHLKTGLAQRPVLFVAGRSSFRAVSADREHNGQTDPANGSGESAVGA
jgi:hypothetical protein